MRMRPRKDKQQRLSSHPHPHQHSLSESDDEFGRAWATKRGPCSPPLPGRLPPDLLMAGQAAKPRFSLWTRPPDGPIWHGHRRPFLRLASFDLAALGGGGTANDSPFCPGTLGCPMSPVYYEVAGLADAHLGGGGDSVGAGVTLALVISG